MVAPKRRGRDAGASGTKVKKRKNAHVSAKPLQIVHDEDEDVDIDDTDLTIFEEFGSRVEFLGALDQESLDEDIQNRASKRARKNARRSEDRGNDARGENAFEEVSDDDAQAYERVKRAAPPDKLATVDLLPFKAPDGSLVYDKSRSRQLRVTAPQIDGVTVMDEHEQGKAIESQKSHAEQGAGASAGAAGDDLAANTHDDKAQKAARKEAAFQRRLNALQGAAAYHSSAVRRESLRQQIAVACAQLMESPEDHLGNLRLVLELGLDRDSQVSRLAMLSLMAVFSDILPGYKIRALTDAELEVKVTKAVQRTRNYEATLVKAFAAYVKLLRGVAGAARASLPHKRVAVRCAAGLLQAVPHFNHVSDVLQLLVPHMIARDAHERGIACDAVAALLARDAHGEAAVEAVQLVADMVRRQKCLCHPAAVRALLALRFVDLSREDVEKGSQALKKRVKMKRKKQREDAVAASLREAAAARDRDEARAQQTLMLEALFELFFRVLKQCVASGALRGTEAGEDAGLVVPDLSVSKMDAKFPLLHVTLQGLGRYTHLIGLEYFTDLMAAFERLLACNALPMRHRARCLLTVVEIMHTQGDALNVDRKGFYLRLYEALAWVPLARMTPSDAGDDSDAVSLADVRALVAPSETSSHVETSEGGASARESEGSRTTEELVAHAASLMLADLKIGDFSRLAAFAKRLASSALHAPTGLAVALLSLCNRLLRRHARLRSMLEGETVGSLGQTGYNQYLADPAEAGALASTLWEFALLQRHVHPSVSESAAAVAQIPPGGGAGNLSGVVNTGQDAAALARAYDVDGTGLMKPVPPAPRSLGRAAQRRPAPIDPRDGSASAAPDMHIVEHEVRTLFRTYDLRPCRARAELASLRTCLARATAQLSAWPVGTSTPSGGPQEAAGVPAGQHRVPKPGIAVAMGSGHMAIGGDRVSQPTGAKGRVRKGKRKPGRRKARA